MLVCGNVPREVLEENLKKAKNEKIRFDEVLREKPLLRRNKNVKKVYKALEELIEVLDTKLKEGE